MRQLPIFKERLNQLLIESGKTIVAFAEALGTSRQSLGYYLNGERIPDAKMIRQICERCNVSADWLLGLSDVKKPNADLQAVSKYIGLSDEAIAGLKTLACKNVLDCILSNDDLKMFLSDMLSNIIMANVEHLSHTKVNNGDIAGIFEERAEYYSFLAGRCTEAIVRLVNQMDDPFMKGDLNNGQP